MPSTHSASGLPIEIQQSPHHGRGVFARQSLVAGTPVIEFRGPRLRRHEIEPGSYHLQIGEDDYLGASGDADDYVNHSCTPNCGFSGSLWLIALRFIAPGEELTWDYSTAIDEPDFDGFPCQCGASGCRGRVRSFRDLDRSLQERLRPSALPYLRAKYFGDCM